jgi:FkbM family methyltransferase
MSQSFTPIGVFRRKVRMLLRVVLPAWVRHASTIRPLHVGAHPGVDTSYIPVTDPTYRELARALRQGRTFIYDLSVFLRTELETRYLCRLARIDRTSLDIGSNVGFYAAAMAPLSLRVFAFEANQRLKPYLSVNLQRFTNVYLMPLAVLDCTGEVVFNVPTSERGDALGNSALGSVHGSFVTSSGIGSVRVSVPTIAIDDLSLHNVGLMKIDVEGSEYDVLRGAAATIGQCRPNIIVENEFRHNEECHKVFEFMGMQAYRGYFVDRANAALRSFEEFDLQRDQISLLDQSKNITSPEKYIFNFIFVPEEADPLKSMLGSPAARDTGDAPR